MKDYLPIGSVVKLKNANKKVMIIGYLPIPNDNPNIMYDYSACIYPEGILTSEQSLVFNHEQIETLYFKGFEDNEQKEFMTKMKSSLTNKNN